MNVGTKAVVTGAVILLASVTACAGGDGTTAAGATTSASSHSSRSTPATPMSPRSSTMSPSPSITTPPPVTFKNIPVYYIAESQRSFKLYREFRAVPDTGGAVASAVSAMTRLAPLDPDYMTPWRPASRIAVSQKGSNIIVDLSADAFSNTNLGSEVATTAVQQLVYTATAAASQSGTPATTVTITKNGHAADVWGTARIGSATRRAPMDDVQGLVWLTSPQEGDVRRAGIVTFTGFGTSFEATFGWVVRTTAGTKVAQGAAMGGNGTGGFGSLAFRTRLERGSYTVTLSTDDPSAGAGGRGPATDDKSFTVR
jgi:hypothetical protein